MSLREIRNYIRKAKRKAEKPDLWVFLAKFSMPFMFSGIYLGIIYLFYDWRALYLLMGLYFFPPLGKESIIPMGVGFGIEPALMAFSIAFVDIVVGLFFALNFDLLKKNSFNRLLYKFSRKQGQESIS